MARRKPDAMAMECMAVLPEYQWICEHRMIRANIGVITNSRPDHLREMGPSLDNITRSLLNTLPDKGVAFTAERKLFSVMKAEADKRGVQLIQVREEEVPEEAMRRFDHLEHRENVAIALGIAKYLKIPQEKALEGMYASHPDPGALRLYTAMHDGKQVRFVNALAANDPESTLTIWQRVLTIYPDPGDVVIMLNTRADRFDRSLQLLEMVGGNIRYDFFVSIGEKTKMLAQYYQRYKIDPSRVVEMGRSTKEHVYQKVFQIISNRATILAIGNMGAGGLDVAYHFRDQGKHKEKTSG
jgi:poly-gamma-glutamate synthase PgsB/CapB